MIHSYNIYVYDCHPDVEWLEQITIVICSCYMENFAHFVKGNFSSSLLLYSFTGIALLHYMI